ncbi:Ferredoxin--NAD(P)(+) reductase (naphthalene dioxygenase ferredoxin-specific) [Aquimixticola soesokkakensis]|uniref:Ferredoxin--NAD(P)(+) reductase (Naphthalene dioxygenase ferredoxin-specific) n=1 Tax=Aquimixticola soesokkakensis TaxID=1519096 RepID=A0A1Y5TDJ0_9RHOB|nr:FAD-binding oxidoreductase [Aquimixticola soesokkakensis]SLN59473.1 Ferredoxin--NAD(P)(+) reductase (naphthalene dioxygenase ferredoxin-specific) [Aquimixticola soesokkakensis]
MTHRLTLKSIEPVTHDTHHLVFERPEGYAFTPGQATDLAVEVEGWRDQKRPFTFVTLPESDTLEFVIKSYPDHEGVTAQIAKLQAGDHVRIEDAWGAIKDEGAGVFIAGGAGITPFLAILRARLARDGTLDGCKLLFSNKTQADIIEREALVGMAGLECHFLVSNQADAGTGVEVGRIDRDYLEAHVGADAAHVYICGPDAMVDEISLILQDIGLPQKRIVTEDFS